MKKRLLERKLAKELSKDEIRKVSGAQIKTGYDTLSGPDCTPDDCADDL